MFCTVVLFHMQFYLLPHLQVCYPCWKEAYNRCYKPHYFFF